MTKAQLIDLAREILASGKAKRIDLLQEIIDAGNIEKRGRGHTALGLSKR